MADTTANLWQQYAEQIAQYTNPNFDPSTQVISFASSTLAVDLANVDPLVTNQTVYSIGNTVPQQSPQYGAKSALDSSYALFLNYVKLKGDDNPNLDSQINIAAGNLTAANVNFLTVRAAAKQAWIADQAGSTPPMDFLAWVQTFNPTYISARDALTAAQSAYGALLSQKNGPAYKQLQLAQNKVSMSGGAFDVSQATPYNMQVRTATAAPPGSTPTLPGQIATPPAISTVTTFAPSYSIGAFGTTYAEWQKKSASNKVDVGPFVITGDSGTNDFSKFGWSASASGGFSYGFFSIGASGSASGSRKTVQMQSTKFEVSFSFTGLGQFLIQPGAWFDLSMIAAFHDSLLDGAPPFFGSGGALALLPKAVILGFEPKITLSLANADYSSFKSSFQQETSGSLSIGPFSIGSASQSTSGSQKSVQWNDSGNSVTIGPIKSALPLLLGVVSSHLGNPE